MPQYELDPLQFWNKDYMSYCERHVFPPDILSGLYNELSDGLAKLQKVDCRVFGIYSATLPSSDGPESALVLLDDGVGIEPCAYLLAIYPCSIEAIRACVESDDCKRRINTAIGLMIRKRRLVHES